MAAPAGSLVGWLGRLTGHCCADCAAGRLRAIAAGAGADERLAGLERYAKCIGLAFQVHDDVLDVEGDTETLGKTQGKDAAQEKTTYATLLGLAEARSRAQLLYRDALATLETFGEKADPLRAIAETIISRNS